MTRHETTHAVRNRAIRNVVFVVIAVLLAVLAICHDSVRFPW